MQIQFTVDGEAHGKGRPRFTRDGHAYTDAKTKAYEHAIANVAREAMGDNPPMTGPVYMALTIRVTPPKSTSATKRRKMLAGEIWPTTKPDKTNVTKAIEDACNGIVYLDDKQIIDGPQTKIYAETAGVDVIIMEVE